MGVLALYSFDLVPSYFQVFDNPKEHLCKKQQSPGLDSWPKLTLGQILYRQSIKRLVRCMHVVLYCNALNNKVFLDLRCSSLAYFLDTTSSLILQGQNKSFWKTLK